MLIAISVLPLERTRQQRNDRPAGRRASSLSSDLPREQNPGDERAVTIGQQSRRSRNYNPRRWPTPALRRLAGAPGSRSRDNRADVNTCTMAIAGGNVTASGPARRLAAQCKVFVIAVQLCRQPRPEDKYTAAKCGKDRRRSIMRRLASSACSVSETGFEFVAKAWMNVRPAGGPGRC
jgi:hypothetical protein